METIFISYWKTPFGELILGDYQGKLALCDWRYRKMRDQVDQRIKSGLNAEFVEKETKLIKTAKKQFEAYFAGGLTEFDLPLHLVGTDFQKQVWEELIKVPFGKTLSYLALSRQLGNEKAIRAVASANGANAISIVVPCHRIIGTSGELTGYAGGLTAKKKLLELENPGQHAQMELF
ncbi:MAG: methylated-DNA--[protein]-cysteine S-methyltransferase [Crocinitomicaceae bacterium]|jgi:methylated-DNA-[protein]-cysteine S-methyltransferase|nr:methylated-DNA--[protein]-cysteine S-methyltransferase [Crocinitomicaceae bacterium]